MSFDGPRAPSDDHAADEREDSSFANPEIRLEFETALGAFILAFNKIDYYVAILLKTAYERNGQSHLYDVKQNFSTRLALLETLAPYRVEMRLLSFAKLREIASARNKLAHGHFEQNPYSGDYKIIAREKVREFPSLQIRAMTDMLNELSQAFILAICYYGMTE